MDSDLVGLVNSYNTLLSSGKAPLQLTLNRVSHMIRGLFQTLWSTTVANSPQARKRARQNDKRRAHNASLRSLVRTKIKQVIAAADTGNAEDARAAYDSAVPVIDRMANRGIIKKNKAARHKSRLNARVKAMAS